MHDRQVERVAQTHESCHFFGGIHVEDACVDVRLVCHNADRMPVHAGESHHCGACEQLMHLYEFAVVHDVQRITSSTSYGWRSLSGTMVASRLPRHDRSGLRRTRHEPVEVDRHALLFAWRGGGF